MQLQLPTLASNPSPRHLFGVYPSRPETPVQRRQADHEYVRRDTTLSPPPPNDSDESFNDSGSQSSSSNDEETEANNVGNLDENVVEVNLDGPDDTEVVVGMETACKLC
jgi:hypothetical protein